jgi:hypothetical protein
MKLISIFYTGNLLLRLKSSLEYIVGKEGLISPAERLEDDLLVKILSYLTSVDLVQVSRTSKRLYFLAWEPELWTTISLHGYGILFTCFDINHIQYFIYSYLSVLVKVEN